MSEEKERREQERALAADFARRLGRLEDGERAQLKRNAGRSLAESRRVHFLFLGKLLPPGAERWREERLFLLATLYPFDKAQRRRDNDARLGQPAAPPPYRSLGHSLLLLRQRLQAKSAGSERSLDTSIARLLDASDSTLSYHLRRAVMRLSEYNIDVNWLRLTVDVLNWTHPSRFVQTQWARDYVAQPQPETQQGQPAA